MSGSSASGRLFRRVLLVLRERAHFLEAYDGSKGMGKVRLPQGDYEEGELLELEVVFVQELMVFHVRGHVGLNAAGGAWLQIAPFDGKSREVILDFARGDNVSSVTRRARRFAVSVDVELANDGPYQTAKTVDLSAAGARLVTTPMPAKGALVALRFQLPDGPFVINAEVVWHQMIPQESFGVMFLAGDPEKRARLDAYIADVLRTDPTGNI